MELMNECVFIRNGFYVDMLKLTRIPYGWGDEPEDSENKILNARSCRLKSSTLPLGHEGSSQ